MDLKEKMEYWVDLADYDLATAEALINTKRFLYVGYMCQLSIEKLLKALYVKTLEAVPPKIHSLSQLIKKIGIESELTEELSDIIDKLELLNIEARYPTYKDEMFKILSNDYCLSILSGTKELTQWIKKKL